MGRQSAAERRDCCVALGLRRAEEIRDPERMVETRRTLHIMHDVEQGQTRLVYPAAVAIPHDVRHDGQSRFINRCGSSLRYEAHHACIKGGTRYGVAGAEPHSPMITAAQREPSWR